MRRHEKQLDFARMFENSPNSIFTVLNNIVDGLITIDHLGHIVNFNKAAEKIFQFQSQEVIGHNVKMLMPEPYRSEHDQYLRNFLNTGVAKIIGIGREVTGLRKDGSVFEMSLSVSQIEIDGEQFFIGLVRDISEHKAAEALQAHFSALIADSDDAIISKSLDGVITSWNPAAESLFGYGADEIIGQSVKQLLPENGWAHEKALLCKIRNGEKVSHCETARVKKNGQLFTASVTISPIKDRQGHITGVSSILRDFSETKQLQQELTAFKQRLTLATKIGGIGIWDYDLIQEKILWDEQMFRLYGYNEQKTEISLSEWQDSILPEDQQRVSATLQQAIEDKNEFEMEFRIIWFDGSIHNIKAAGQVLCDDTSEAIRMVGVNWDITRQKEIEQLKNEFISTVSHELRTPLTSIQGALDLILGGAMGDVDKEIIPLLKIASQNSNRLVRLINDILDIEKIESGKMQILLKPHLLNEIIDHTIATMEAYCQQFQVTIVLDNQCPDCYVNVDQDRLIQVLTNLISNAAKFSPPDSAIEVAVRKVDDRVRVSVTDTGSGIPTEFKNKIFNKFSQADSSSTRTQGGTGLGLNICKALIEKMDGHIDYISEPNVKTSFFFDLPLYRQPLENSVPPFETQKSRILICEDDPDIAHLLQLMLKQNGYQADISLNAEQAKEKLKQNTYSALTLDLMLPGQSGIDFFKELRASDKTRKLPVIIVSAFLEEGKKQLNGDVLMVDDWLSKPVNPENLKASIIRAINHNKTGLPRILHIEDDPDIVTLVKTLLKNKAIIEAAPDLEAAKKCLQQDFDLIILDLSLPDGSSSDLLPYLSSRSPTTPVLIFSADDSTSVLAGCITQRLVKSKTPNDKLLQAIKTSLSDNLK